MSVWENWKMMTLSAGDGRSEPAENTKKKKKRRGSLTAEAVSLAVVVLRQLLAARGRLQILLCWEPRILVAARGASALTSGGEGR